jgi:lysine-N-methylase
MPTTRSLPVIMPRIAGQRWSCHSCAYCCRALVVHLTDDDRERIEGQGWRERLGVAPFVRIGRGWALNKRADGACVFLDHSNRCRIHSEFGEQAKPLACRLYPFSVRSVRGGWLVALRFDCPSVIESKGKPIEQHRFGLEETVKGLPDLRPDETAVDLQRGVRASAEEADGVVRRFTHWLGRDKLPMTGRLIRAARLTTTLAEATLGKVRGPRFAELLDLLFGAQESESATVPETPTDRQRGMLRQLAFAHAEHVSLAELRSGWGSRMRKRWQQLRSARRLLAGRGRAPNLLGLAANTSIDSIDTVRPATDRVSDVEDILTRYLRARFESRSTFGDGYYGWSIVNGLSALWLSVAVMGWLARCVAASEGRASVCFEDVARALAAVDRAATRLPALGTFSERARVSYLLRDDGVARLIRSYSLCGEAS